MGDPIDKPQCGWCGGKGYVLSNGMVAKRVPCGCAPTDPTPTDKPQGQWTWDIDDARRVTYYRGGVEMTTSDVLAALNAGPTGHDTPAPTPSVDQVYEVMPDEMAHWTTRGQIEAVLVAVEALSGRAATPDPHYPEHAWVWADGNYFDAVVIHREWSRYQRAAMQADPDYAGKSTATPDPPPGVERDGDGWKLRQGSQYPIDPRWEIDYPGFGWRPLTEMEARGRVAGADRQVRPVASITEEPTGGSLASSIAAAKEAAEALTQHPNDPACPACRRPLSEHRPGIYDCPSDTEDGTPMAEPLTPDELAMWRVWVATRKPVQGTRRTIDVARMLATVDAERASAEALQAMVDACRDLVAEWVDGEDLEDGDDLHEALADVVGWPPGYGQHD